MKHSAYFENFYPHLITESLTQGMITAFCSRYSRLLNGQRPRGVHDTDAAIAEMEVLDAAIEKLHPKCLPDHAASGLEFLWNKVFTPKGAFRRTAHAKEFGANDQLFLQDCKHFGGYSIHLTGCNSAASNDGRIVYVRPNFMVWMPWLPRPDWSRPPRSLHYSMTPWQSGGHFEITLHAGGSA